MMRFFSGTKFWSVLCCLVSCRSLWDAEWVSGWWTDDSGWGGFGCRCRWQPTGDQPHSVAPAGVCRYGWPGTYRRKTSHAVSRCHPAGQYITSKTQNISVVLHRIPPQFCSSPCILLTLWSCDRELSISPGFCVLLFWSSGSFCTGQRPRSAIHHAGEAQGQRPVRVGHHRAVRGTRLRGARDHRCWAPTHQILRSDHVAHSRPFTGGVWPVLAAAGIRGGSAEGEEARTVSSQTGIGRHGRWRGK